MIFIRLFAGMLIAASVLAGSASAQQADETSVVRQVFPDARLLPCGKVRELSTAECEYYKSYIGYRTWQFRAAMWYESMRSTVWRLDLHSLARFDRSLAEPVDESGRSTEQYFQTAQKERAALFSRRPFPLSECLRSECGRVIVFDAHAHEEWAKILDIAMSYFACLDNRDPSLDLGPYCFHGCLFRHAEQGYLPQCSPEGVPKAVFSLGDRLSPPSNKF